MYADDSDESINKKANIDEFVNSIDEFCKLNKDALLSDFLNQVTLSSDTDEMDETEYVTLATIHSVKGLEFKVVFLAGLEENIMPVSRAAIDTNELEEERRLMYVAITRARERLFFTRSKSRYLYGERSMTLQSRFIGELSSLLGAEEKPRGYSGYSEYGYAGAARSSYGGYRDGAAARRSYQSFKDKRDEDYGYQSDLPAGPSSSYSAASSFGGAKSAQKSAPYGIHTVKPDKDYSKFRAGVKVRHAKFGEGMIVSTKGEGSALVLNVSFAGLGIKQLSAQLAPIEIIG